MHNKKMFSLSPALKIDSAFTAFSVSTGIVRSVSQALNMPVQIEALQPPSFYSFTLPGLHYEDYQLFAAELAHSLTCQFAVTVEHTGILCDQLESLYEITVYILIKPNQLPAPKKETIPEPEFSNNYMFP